MTYVPHRFGGGHFSLSTEKRKCLKKTDLRKGNVSKRSSPDKVQDKKSKAHRETLSEILYDLKRFL
jgi:hypothetical protein